MDPSEHSWRDTLNLYLNDMDAPEGQQVALFIVGLVFFSCGIFVAETYPVSLEIRAYLRLIDRIILSLFGLEYILRLWCADRPLRYLFSLYALLDVLAILPFFFGLDTRFVRLLRWFRILRLVRYFRGHTIVGYISSDDVSILSRILFTLCSIIFVYSGLIYQFEHQRNIESFQTFLDAVYFCVVTMSTVGFGDLTPVSEPGRLLTVLMILTGIALLPWQLGELIRYFVRASSRIEITCSNCGTALHESDALYCRVCGQVLEDPACSESLNQGQVR